MSDNRMTVGIIGGGAWGAALGAVAARAGNEVVICTRNAATAKAVNCRHRHPRLASAPLPAAITATIDAADLKRAAFIVIATPAQAFREVSTTCARRLAPLPVVITSKGIEILSGKFMTEILAEVWPHAEPLVLSGPSFAADVILGQPTAVALAAKSLERAAQIAASLSIPAFRIYSSSDLLGVQLGGAMKNVLAIACGISDGKGLGESARAALTTRAFSEMLRFGEALGVEKSTLTGLSGLGDLLLTCSSQQSRNFSFGLSIGRNRHEMPDGSESTIEGFHTAKAIVDLARRLAIDLPICEAVHSILEGKVTVDAAITRLLMRPLRTEQL